MLRRRACVISAAIGWWVGPSAAARADAGSGPTSAARGHAHERPLPAELARQRLAWLDAGEAALAAGDAAAAEAWFDRAAAVAHAADAELALVRCYLQQGQYRRAMAFCAHTAGVHLEAVDAAALYVWLLHAGGQHAFAQQQLAAALQRFPGHALLTAVAREAGRDWPRLDDAVRHTPARFAPFAHGDPVPEDAAVAGSATLWSDGLQALLPRSMLVGSGRVWLRNGLGRTVAVAADDLAPLPTLPALARVRLREPLPVAAAARPAAVEPFAGRPGYTFDYSPDEHDAGAAWPRLRTGFLGRPAGPAGWRRLGLAVPPGPRGGPVLDDAGRLAGIALDGGRWLGAPALAAQLTDDAAAPPADPTPSVAADRVAPDQAYEHGLLHALQVIVRRA